MKVVSLRRVSELHLRKHSTKLDVTYGAYCVTLIKNVVRLDGEYDVIDRLSYDVMFHLAGAGYTRYHVRRVKRQLGEAGAPPCRA